MVTATRTGITGRILIAVFGSRGNVFPLLALGRALQQRGHSVVFATTERYRDAVVKAGIEYRLLRPDPLPSPGEAADPSKGDSESGLRGVVFPRVEETYRDLLSAGNDVEVMVFPMFIFPGPLAAERLGVPWVEVHFTPGTLNSVYDPPFLPPLPWLYPLQRATPLVPRLFDPIARAALRSWHKPLYDLRAREGFAPDKGTPLLGGMRSPWLTLGMFSPVLGGSQKDWPQPNAVTGFPFYDEDDGSVPPEVTKFLDDGEPPIVAALGSVATEDRRKFFTEAIAAANSLKHRLLLLAGGDADWLREQDLPPSILAVPYAPYADVFPRCSAILISGSVGPISHALRSGRPLLIVPAASKADQPDNALRVTRLGLARWVMLSECDKNRLTAELTELLRNGAYETNALCVAEQVRAEDGLAAACEKLEFFLKSRRS